MDVKCKVDDGNLSNGRYNTDTLYRLLHIASEVAGYQSRSTLTFLLRSIVCMANTTGDYKQVMAKTRKFLY